MTEINVLPEKIIDFKNYKFIESSDLLKLSDEYVFHQQNELVPVLKKNNNKCFKLIIARMENDGNWGKKTVTGKICDVSDDGFSFFTSSDYYEDYEKPIKKFISFKNVLGDVPMLIDAPDDMNPFKFNQIFPLVYYFKKLEKMKKLLESCVGIVHHVKLFFRYDEKHHDLREGNFFMDCEILKVNKSNVEIKHLRSFAFLDINKSYVDLVPRNQIQSYISPECYLWKIAVSFGSVCKINPHDSN